MGSFVRLAVFMNLLLIALALLLFWVAVRLAESSRAPSPSVRPFEQMS